MLTTTSPRPVLELLLLRLTSGGLAAIVDVGRAEPSDLHMLSALSS